MRYTVYRIIVCSRTKIRMISSLRNLCVRILDANRFTIVVFQILDIKSNYLPGIVQYLAVLTVNINFFQKSESIVQLSTAIHVRNKSNFCQNEYLFFTITVHDYRSRLHQT
jgi:hypothetical protein